MQTTTFIKRIAILFILCLINFGFIEKVQSIDLTINAKGSEAEVQYAHFKVVVDGQEIGDAFTTTDIEPYMFPLSTDPSTIKEIRVVFDNDAAGNGMDRNLYVESIEIEGMVIVASGENVTYIRSDGSEYPYSGIMRWNGDLIFNPTEKIVVNARGSQYSGDYAHFKVLVDGQEIGEAVTTSEYMPYFFSTSKDPSTIQVVQVVFDNDAAGNGMDRNLYVESIQLGDRVFPAMDSRVQYVRNDGQVMEYTGIMRWNGALIFDVEDVPIVCEGDITLSSQAEVDAFSCSEIVRGSLTIKGNDIVNLDGLSELTYVGETLEIYRNPNLTDINGLSALKSIGYQLYIIQNDLLENLSGLDNVEEIGDHVGIISNYALKNIDAISKLNCSLFSFEVENNQSLRSIDGFNSLKHVQQTLSISSNQSLKSINGFNSIGNPNEVYIGSNSSLELIEGLNSIYECEYISISNNPGLKNIIGFESLKVLSGFDKGVFQIHDNPELVTINCISAIDHGMVVIDRNSKLKDIFGPTTKPDEISISLKISNNNALENVDGLKSLTKASLNLTNNAALENLDGLVNLNEAILTIENNQRLVSFCGLYPVFHEGDVRSWSISNNGIEITNEEILSNGPCGAAEIVVSAKGSQYAGDYAHFTVLVDGQQIGDAVTTSDYEPYIFTFSEDPSAVQEVKVVFDNDAAGNGMDRNLYVECIQLGYKVLPAIDPSVVYVRSDGQIMDYTGIMHWNGALIFDAEEVPVVCEGDITLSSQAEVDACLCSEIQGSLTIRGSDIVNLDGLDNLEKIGLYLGITDNESLENIDGFQELESCGVLEISDNDALQHIDGFNTIKYLYTLSIRNNTSLEHLKGFNSLHTLDEYGLSIHDNPKIEYIQAFSLLKWVGQLSVLCNNSLRNLDFLSSLSGAYEDFYLSGNNALENIDGLSSLQQVKGSLTIDNNPLLNDINGLIGLRKITDQYGHESNGLYIQNNISLTNVDGLQSLEIVNYNLNIVNNSSLASFCGLYPLLNQSGVRELIISNNGIEITKEEILANGLCDAENEIIVSAKGTSCNGEYAHFKIFVDGQEIGDAVTTSLYVPYIFTLSKDPSSIQEVKVVFDNDAAGNGMDRNLYVESIEFDGMVIEASGENVTYIRSDGSEYPYNGIMRWNGQLIFDQFELNNAFARKSKDSSYKNEEFSSAVKMQVYPNPAEQEYSIELINAVKGPANVIMHDLSGRQVLRHNFYVDETSELQQIKISRLDRGVYILNITTGDHQHFLEKMIIE